jgi:putative endonuclease
MAEHIKAGRRAEAAARDFLRRQGYLILFERYRWRGGEIDLIARDGPCLVFIEVKSRSSHSHGLPEEAITPHKQQKLILTAKRFISEYPSDLEMRFDVVALSDGRLRLYRDAFRLDER